MNFPVHGYNECLITVHPCRRFSYTWKYPQPSIMKVGAQNGAIVSPHKVEGIELHLRYQGTEAGPLFWAQYSFLGARSGGTERRSIAPSYFDEMRNLTLVNRR